MFASTQSSACFESVNVLAKHHVCKTITVLLLAKITNSYRLHPKIILRANSNSLLMAKSEQHAENVQHLQTVEYLHKP